MMTVRARANTYPNKSSSGGFLDSHHRPISSLSRVNNKRKSNSTVYATNSSTPPRNNNTSICLADSPQTSDRTLQSSHSGFQGSGSLNSNNAVKLTPISLKLPIGPAAAASANMVTSSPVVPVNGGAKNDSNDEQNIVTIKILPDEQGRFGFNVKGGVDQKMPIIVSRVGANTPADKCFPRLNEGDQLVLINGRDVADHSHDQVVNFIRACSEPHSGQIELAVKQVLT